MTQLDHFAGNPLHAGREYAQGMDGFAVADEVGRLQLASSGYPGYLILRFLSSWSAKR